MDGVGADVDDFGADVNNFGADVDDRQRRHARCRPRRERLRRRHINLQSEHRRAAMDLVHRITTRCLVLKDQPDQLIVEVILDIDERGGHLHQCSLFPAFPAAPPPFSSARS